MNRVIKICRRRLAICCSIISIVLYCLPSVGITNSNSLNVLTDVFDDAIKTSSLTDTFEIQYCPDNTCETFQAVGENKDVLADFVVLYLYYASGYTILIFPDDEGLTNLDKIRREAERLKNKYLGNCLGDDLETVSCILTGLVKTHGISGFFVRYDEGQKNIGKVDLLKEVSIERLEKTRDWRGKHYSK